MITPFGKNKKTRHLGTGFSEESIILDYQVIRFHGLFAGALIRFNGGWLLKVENKGLVLTFSKVSLLRLYRLSAFRLLGFK